MKRLIICCDGTWNAPDRVSPTNVVKLALRIAPQDRHEVEQRVLYHAGVGTKRWERIRGGVFGAGLSRDVQECYRFLVENFDSGDEIFLVGFSRGAFTARSIAGLVRNCGVLRPHHLDKLGDAYRLYRDRDPISHPRLSRATLFRRSFSLEPPIRFIGVFDTVGALGVPVNLFSLGAAINRRWRFHDTALSTQVRYAFQALAIDEKRGSFVPALWHRQEPPPGQVEPQVLEQVWFAGVHSDVGGGYEECALAEIPLLWMAERAAEAGLEFDDAAFAAVSPPLKVGETMDEVRAEGRYARPDPGGTLHESRRGILWGHIPGPYIRCPGSEEVSVQRRGQPPCEGAARGPRRANAPEPRWCGRPPWAPWRTPDDWEVAADQWIASSARDRRTAKGDFRPSRSQWVGGPPWTPWVRSPANEGYAWPNLAEFLGARPGNVKTVRTTAGLPRP